MQEAGIPVTFGYISDAHDVHGVSGNDPPRLRSGRGRLRPAAEGLRQGVRRLLHAPEERRDHQGQHAVRGHRRGERPLRRHRARRRRATASRRRAPTPTATSPRSTATSSGIVATYNASHGTTATTNFSVHSDMAPNVYITGNPARDSATARDAREGDVRHERDEPAVGQTAERCSSRWPTRSRRSSSTWSPPTRHGRRRSRRSRRATTSSTRRQTTTCTNGASQLDLSTCVFLPNTAPPNQTFAWNHGGIQPEVRSTWIGWVGPGVAKQAQTDKVWTDHTDIRPTMLALLGLQDDYVSDGRVVTEFLKTDATAEVAQRAQQRRREARRDVEADQRVVRPVLAGHALRVDRRARERHGRRHHLHEHRERARSPSARSATGSPTRSGWRSGTPSSANQKIDPKKAKDWIKQGQGYLDQAARPVRDVLVRVRERQAARQGQPHRRHLRGEPQLRQPVRRLGGRQRPRERRRRRTPPRSTRPATRTPASSRTT